MRSLRIVYMRKRVIATALLSALVLVPTLAVAQAPSTHFNVLHAFHGSDGEFMTSSVILDVEGNVYGATFLGGDLNCPDNPGVGCGAVFELGPTGKEKVLHKFTGPDGLGPMLFGVLTRDSRGNLYGTTVEGGTSNAGTVFRINPTGKETVLYNFTGGADGREPFGGVIRDAKGNLYGTTAYGGAAGHGTVYKVDTTGKETVLYSFTGSEDGATPVAGLVRDSAGNLYGTASSGGAGCGSGCGVVFKLNHAGKETVLHAFTGSNGDGSSPFSSLVRDQKGNLYGTTSSGGIGASGSGTVFKVTKSEKETILYAFSGGDGLEPTGSVVFDSAGNLYGTTLQGGSFGYGTVFKLTQAGKETVLHNFSGGKDGAGPDCALALDGTGSLYGTTQLGGDLKCAVQGQGQGCGVVFKVTP